MDDRLEKMLAEGPKNDEEAYELKEYVREYIVQLHSLRNQALTDISDLWGRHRYLGKEMDTYRIRAKKVMPDFGY